MKNGRHQTNKRILFLATGVCSEHEVYAALRAGVAPDADVMVVVPTFASTLDGWTVDEADVRAAAELRLENTVQGLRANGLRARGIVGDADPLQAIADALWAFRADEIVICADGADRPRWPRRPLAERAQERFTIPVTELELESREPVPVA